MKKIVVIISSIVFLNVCLSAQRNQLITVKAGTKVLDYFPVKERYLYPEFISGQVVFNNNTVNNANLNYSILQGEIEFTQSHDTLTIIRKKEVQMVVIAKDTFYYDNGYIRLISGGNVKVGIKQYVKLKEVVKKGAYGTASRGSAIDTYESMDSGGKFYELIPNEDLILEKTSEYYLSVRGTVFVQFRKKNVLQLFPQKETEIQKYLKSYRVNFDSREDLLRFAEYLRTL